MRSFGFAQDDSVGA